jgi:hypothetical protein
METPENITMILPETGTLLTRRGKNRKNLAKRGVPDGARIERLAKAQKKPRQATGLS